MLLIALHKLFIKLNMPVYYSTNCSLALKSGYAFYKNALYLYGKGNRGIYK